MRREEVICWGTTGTRGIMYTGLCNIGLAHSPLPPTPLPPETRLKVAGLSFSRSPRPAPSRCSVPFSRGQLRGGRAGGSRWFPRLRHPTGGERLPQLPRHPPVPGPAPPEPRGVTEGKRDGGVKALRRGSCPPRRAPGPALLPRQGRGVAPGRPPLSGPVPPLPSQPGRGRARGGARCRTSSSR